MTEDIVYDDSAWTWTMRGHGDVREFLEFLWRAMPDLEFQDLEGPFLSRGEPTVAFYWRGTATFTGPLDPPGFAPTGARVAFEGFELLEFRDDRVCRLRIVYDMMDVSRQIGIVPDARRAGREAGAAAERLSVSVRNRFRGQPGPRVGLGANVKAVQRMFGHASAAMTFGHLRRPVR